MSQTTELPRITETAGRPRKTGSLGRLRGLLRKEFLQIGRDPSSIAIAFLLPAVLLLIFGYGVSLDAKNVPIALVVEQPSTDTASFTARFAQSPYFRPQQFLPRSNRPTGRWRRARCRASSGCARDFARRLQAGGAPIGVIVNGVDANDARIIEGYLQQIWAQLAAPRAAEARRIAPADADRGASRGYGSTRRSAAAIIWCRG